MKKILVLDNYDSFTYNLVHYLEEQNAAVSVFRNDEIDTEFASTFDKIVISPGPGIPDEAGITKELIKTLGHSKSILGICLGHQAIAEVYGGQLTNLEKVYHGIDTEISILDTTDYLFFGLPKNIMVGRYHSWIVSQHNLPEVLTITAVDQNNQIMGLKHTHFDIRSVQFHPESIMTLFGKKIIENWVKN